jgi:hypothetical protein
MRLVQFCNIIGLSDIKKALAIPLSWVISVLGPDIDTLVGEAESAGTLCDLHPMDVSEESTEVLLLVGD